MRVYELARELDLKSNELLKICADLGLSVGNRLSGLSDAQARQLRKAASGNGPKGAIPKQAAAPIRPAKPKADTAKDTPAETKGKKAAREKRPSSLPKAKAKPTAARNDKTGARKPHKGRSMRNNAGQQTPNDNEPRQLPSRFVPPSSVQRYRRRPMRRSRSRRSRKPFSTTVARTSEVSVQPPISIKDLSAAAGIKANAILLKLMQAGAMLNINAMLNEEQVRILADDLKLPIVVRETTSAEDVITEIESNPDQLENLKPRPPVVTLLGHVDHGKTTLLDYIRKANVVAGEHGGITQHIGAYRVTLRGNSVVFLDTPGHEAFTTMRARGANVTDIVTLVVAADDGVMPQTEEAIDHAKAADVPIVVAINKCDKPEADPNRVKQQLTNLGLQPEEWGGDTVTCEVSALTGQGVDELVEMLALVAELRELKANPNKPGMGTVLEAEISESHGPVATVLLQEGALRIGDPIVCGHTFGRVKTLIDDNGQPLKEAGPATPVTVVGLDEAPGAGDQIVALGSLQQARAVAEERRQKRRMDSVAKRRHVSLETLFAAIEEGKANELRVILKADGRGSLEALSQVLGSIKSDEVSINLLRSSVGSISTSDVILADASDALIVGLHVVAGASVRTMADEKGVAIHTYNVIYRVKEEIERALEGLLEPEEREIVTGHTEVRQVFRTSRFGNIAGCYVIDGTVARSHRFRLVRDGKIIHEGRLASLRREKDDVREVREGFECGIHLEGYDDIKTGDIIETFTVEKVARTLGGESGSR